MALGDAPMPAFRQMIVTIAAAAGEPEAIRDLVAGLPARSGIAYILVPHPDAKRPPMTDESLAGLLADAAPFPVVEVTDGMALLPDRLHVTPAGRLVSVSSGMLRLAAATSHQDGPPTALDRLLQSLARKPGINVVAVLLSGHGADVSQGLRTVHDTGGYIIARDAEEVGHDGMPATGTATGSVDAVLPVAAMGAAIIARRNRLPLPAMAARDWIEPALDRLKIAGHDFSGYKVGTMQRRIERRARMAEHASGSGADALAAYAARLDADESELEALANDLLINVTSLFRDTAVFETLEKNVIPELVRRHDESRALRVWCAGCSSGEEAWSLAMLFIEEITRSRPTLKFQLFATDLDADAIAAARRGIYPASIESDVSPRRLQRFFIADDEGWRIGPALQASVVFAVHDLLTDPPFSRIDMISCRNLLIYLQPAAQARAISLFHFALRPGGLLLLGKAEAVLPTADTPPPFTLVSPQDHLYRRNAGHTLPADVQLELLPVGAETGTARPSPSRSAQAPPWPLPSLPSARLRALEAELASIRAELANSDRNPGSLDPEQMALHAETLSRNQEYLSANQELITSQQELQSLNEELVALNGQLQETIDRQRTLADDLQNILCSTNVATIFLDMENHIRFFTPATRSLFNMLPSDVGRAFSDLAPITPDPTLMADIAAVRAGSHPADTEIEAEDGICYSRRVLPYRVHDNRTEGVIVTYTDVTDRKRAERSIHEARVSAESANLAKSRFLAAASHDLRQPLQSLVLLQELLARKVKERECQQLLARLERTLESMSAMLDGLLDINRIEADSVEIAPGCFPLDALLAEVVQGLSLQAVASKLKLRHVRTGYHVVSDRRLLAGMLRNLVANGLKYTRTGGVLIGARRREDTVRIEVWDTGIGIPADQFDIVFKPYQQLGPPLVDRSNGLGLGLSIVRSLGDMLGHKVDLRSRPGHGSVFSIEVPLAEPASMKASPRQAISDDKPSAPAPASRTGGAKVLVVDDDIDVLELLAHLLRDAGHSVVTARDDEAALASLQHHTPNLIISDFRLSGRRDGLELAQALRAALMKTKGRKVPVIMLTGDISIDALMRFAANDILRLSKPVRPAELHAAIDLELRRPAQAEPAGAARQEKVVHVIDDDLTALQSFGQLLAEAGLPARLHGSSEAFRVNWDPATTGCLLVDACLPGESGLDLLRSLHDAGTLPPSIMITGQGDIGMAVAAMKAGALDFIEKPASGNAIINGIQRALASDTGAVESERAAAEARLAALTERQREVMAMVLDGHPSKIIAADLKLSQRTVEHHRAEIMHRTGCRSLPELARLVLTASSGGARPS